MSFNGEVWLIFRTGNIYLNWCDASFVSEVGIGRGSRNLGKTVLDFSKQNFSVGILLAITGLLD
jgi:hypothetical protein